MISSSSLLKNGTKVVFFQLQVRFGGDDNKVRFDDEYEDTESYRDIEYSPSTTTTTQQTPIMLDPIMEAMMQTVNITELNLRFDEADQTGLGLRNAFGVEEDHIEVEAYK